MEQQPGQDPERDGPAGPQPAEGSPDAGLPDSPAPADAPGSPGTGPDADAQAGDAARDADDDASDFGPWEGLEGTLGAAKARAELLSAFAPGGAWDGHPPGPELAAALAEAVGPQWRCGLGTGPELVGLLRAMASLQSWSGAGLLGIIRALIRDDDLEFAGRPRHGDLPDVWDDSLTHEIALALAVSAGSAEKTTRAAWELGARLPGVELLLRDGTLDVPRAKLIAEVFGDLSDDSCAEAQELLLPELTEPPRKTYTQIERIATAIAAAVDPDLAERRRKKAEKNMARVTMFREGSGTAGLSGRDLPTDETLAAFAHVAARAQQYKGSGAFPGERIDRLRATAYLDILNSISADDRIAYGRLSPDEEQDDADRERLADRLGFGPAGQRGPGSAESGESGGGGSDCPCDECDGRCAPPDDNDLPDDGEPDDGEPGDDEPGDDVPGGDVPGGHDGPGTGSGGAHPGGAASDGERPETAPPAPRPPVPGPADVQPALTDLILPLATLLGRDRRPGEGHGLGTLDPALCRALAATATRSPDTTICVTVTDPDGIAIGHGCATPARHARPPDGPAPPLIALPARINLTITATRLAELRPRPEIPPPEPPKTGPPGPPGPRQTPPSGPTGTGWALTRRGPAPPGDPDWCGPWTLTLPTGLDYRVDLVPVPTYGCDHRNESHAYKPNATLRHLIQVRDCTCTFPSCNRHARDSDFEHARPYDQGGRTCACNARARSRKCHRVKQSPGWNLTQPRPGWHQWATPRGRTYTQGPKHYPV